MATTDMGSVGIYQIKSVPVAVAAGNTQALVAAAGTNDSAHLVGLSVSADTAAGTIEIEDGDGNVLATWKVPLYGGLVLPVLPREHIAPGGGWLKTPANKALNLVATTCGVYGVALVAVRDS